MTMTSPLPLRARMAALWLASSALALSACETTDVPVYSPPPRGPVVEAPPNTPDTTPITTPGADAPDDDTQVVDVEPRDDGTVRDGVTPAHLAGQDLNRLALLLPLSSENARLRQEAQSMLQAAELAIFERDTDDTVLVVLDTRGTERGARDAAKAALDRGADVILGPVLSGEVEAVSREVRGTDIPVLAFSTDSKVAGNGTYLMSFPPEAEVRRVVDYAASTGVSRYAIIHPNNDYGRRVADAYRSAVARVGGSITASESYSGGTVSDMQEPVNALARAYGNGNFQAVLLPEGGTALRSLAPLLPYSNTKLADVLFMGTALWMRQDTAREPALRGGVFAGPDEAARAGFESAYRNAYRTDPTTLASLARDAVAFGAFIADGDPERRRSRAESASGFYGADGFVALRPDGQPDRGLAIYRIDSTGYRVLEPAPRGPIGSN